MWFKGKKTAKEKGKNYFPALPTAWDKDVGKAGLFSSKTCQLFQQGSFANVFVQWLCQ
jgi:hypothetical protein